MAQLERARVAAPNLIIPVVILDSSSATGAKLSTVVFNSSGLKITAQRELDAAPTTYSVAGSTIETIAAIGTYAAPTATKVRFAPVDTTNAPGDYQLMVSQALGGNGDGSHWLKLTLSGVTNMAPVDILIQLDANEAADVYTRVGAAGAGLTALGDARLANLDAAVSSRSTYAGGDTTGTTTLLSRITAAVALASDWTSARAAKVDNLDAAITTRLASASYTAPDNADIVTSLADLVTLLSRITGAVALNSDIQTLLARVTGTVLLASGYTAPPSAAANAAAVLAAAATTPIAADMKKVNGVTINGAGTLGNEFAP